MLRRLSGIHIKFQDHLHLSNLSLPFPSSHPLTRTRSTPLYKYPTRGPCSSSTKIFSRSFRRTLPLPLLPSCHRRRRNSNTSSSSAIVRFLHSPMATASKPGPTSLHDFVVKDSRGNDVDLSQYKGKVLLIVNVASQCGLTNSNYTQLGELYTKYKDQGLEILAFPCNQFGSQEPGTNDQIVEFACTRFKAEFPIFDKVDVNGDKAAPIYKFLKSRKGGLFGDGIKWNFTKFLADKDGNVVQRYAPTTSPSSIEKDVKKLLEAS